MTGEVRPYDRSRLKGEAFELGGRPKTSRVRLVSNWKETGQPCRTAEKKGERDSRGRDE